MRNILKIVFLLVLATSSHGLIGQEESSISGNLDIISQYYTEDEDIGAAVPPSIMGLNGVANIIYTKGAFTAGARLESYLNPLQGFPGEFRGTGVGYRFASWQNDDMEVTIGNFYEQYGSGMLLRAFEERALGIDNSFDGAKVLYRPAKGVTARAMIGKQRALFDDRTITTDGVFRAVDLEVNLGQLFSPILIDSTELNISIGGNFLSKFNDDNTTGIYNLPTNVGAYSGRITADYKGFRLMGEYSVKENDPYATTNDFNDPFNYLYKNGEGVILTGGYSTKGFAIDLTAKHTDNILWRSTNAPVGPFAQQLGFNPAITRQHTYNLAATLYPYATNLFGEVAGGVNILAKAPKGSSIGGKYGTSFDLSLAIAGAPKREYLNDAEGARQGYKTSLFSVTDSLLVRDFNLTVSKKISKKFKAKAMYMNLHFEDRAILVAKIHEFIKADIAIVELQYKINKKHSIRMEAQGLWTEQDQQDWAFGLIEYTISPHWSITALNQYNYGNNEAKDRIHYWLGNVVYSKGSHRFSFQYGKQRAGFFCVGGICRFVPASNGATFTLTTNF